MSCLTDIANKAELIMSQLSFSDIEFGAKREQTRHEKFLSEIDQVIPWARLVKLIEPVYPKGNKEARPTYLRRCCAFISCSSGLV